MVKTVILGGTEYEANFETTHTRHWVQNMSDNEVLASLSGGISEGKDGVLTVLPGGISRLRSDVGVKKIYLLGTGKVQIIPTDNDLCPSFKMASGGGDSGSGEATSYKILTGTVTPGPQDTQITFAEAFNTVPIVIGTMYNSSSASASNGRAETCHTTAISTTGWTFETRYIYKGSSSTDVAGSTSGALHWVAIGT